MKTILTAKVVIILVFSYVMSTALTTDVWAAAQATQKPLIQPLKLTPNAIAINPPQLPDFDNLNKQISETSYHLHTNNMNLTRAYREWESQYLKSCKNREYTVADQSAAGCKPSESMQQCLDKLYPWCVSEKKKTMGWQYFQRHSQKALELTEKLKALVTEYNAGVQLLISTYGK